MAYYKIRSITNTLAKRDINKDIPLNIEYNVGFKKNQYKLNAGGEVLISCRVLPTQVQILRNKGLIVVNEISETEFVKNQKPSAKKTAPVEVKSKKKATPKSTPKVETTVEKTSTTEKKRGRKPKEEESTVEE